MLHSAAPEQGALKVLLLVTHNGKDFLLGWQRNGPLRLHSRDYLARLYQTYHEAEASVAECLELPTWSWLPGGTAAKARPS